MFPVCLIYVIMSYKHVRFDSHKTQELHIVRQRKTKYIVLRI